MCTTLPQLINYYAYEFVPRNKDSRISATILFSGDASNDEGMPSDIAYIYVEQLSPAARLAGGKWELLENTPGTSPLAWNEETVTTMNLLVNPKNGSGFFLLTPSSILTNSVQFTGSWKFTEHIAINAPIGLPQEATH